MDVPIQNHNSKRALCAMAVVDSSVEEDSLFMELFEARHYNRRSHPVESLSQTIHVQLSIVLLKIAEVVCTTEYFAQTSHWLDVLLIRCRFFICYTASSNSNPQHEKF